MTAPFHANMSVAEKSNTSSSLVLVWCIGLSWRLVCGRRKHNIIYQLFAGILSYSSFSCPFFILFRRNTCTKPNKKKKKNHENFLWHTKKKTSQGKVSFLPLKLPSNRGKMKHSINFLWMKRGIWPKYLNAWLFYSFSKEQIALGTIMTSFMKGRLLMWLTPTTLARFFWIG